MILLTDSRCVRTEQRLDPKCRTQISEKAEFNPKWVLFTGNQSKTGNQIQRGTKQAGLKKRAIRQVTKKHPKKTIILLFKGQHRREVLTVCHRSDAMLLKTLFKEAEDRKYKTITGVSKLMESKTVVVWSGCNDHRWTGALRSLPVFINSSDVWFWLSD